MVWFLLQHRLSSVRGYDGAVVLQQGVVTENVDVDNLLDPRASLTACEDGSAIPGQPHLTM